MRCELIRVGKRKTLQSSSLVFFVASKGTLRNVLHHRPGYSIQFSQTPKGQPNPTSKCKCLAIFSPAYHTTKLLLSTIAIASRGFFAAPSVMWSKVKTFHLGFHLRKYRGWKHYLRYFHNSFATSSREKLEKWPNFVVAAEEDLAQLNTPWVCLQLSTRARNEKS